MENYLFFVLFLFTELKGFARPKAWSRELWQLDENGNNGFEVYVVWQYVKLNDLIKYFVFFIE